MLNNERFLVPEAAFHPSDVGLDQGGLAQAAMEAVAELHPALRPLVVANVICVGGLAACPGLEPRLHAELRACMPAAMEVCMMAIRIGTIQSESTHFPVMHVHTGPVLQPCTCIAYSDHLYSVHLQALCSADLKTSAKHPNVQHCG